MVGMIKFMVFGRCTTDIINVAGSWWMEEAHDRSSWHSKGKTYVQ